MIKIGDSLPEATLYEFIDEEREGCSLGPNAFSVTEMVKGKKIVIFAVPGAFTPTCSEQHLPGYVNNAQKFHDAGVDEIWCVAVNDAFVMGAWGRAQHVAGKVRMLADGSGLLTKALGLEMDLSGRGLGVRSQRYAMVVDNGVVKTLNVEAPGKFEASKAETILGT
jgi:peroxiredoxin